VLETMRDGVSNKFLA